MKTVKNNIQNILARKHQAGMTLTESLLVLSVGALVAVLAYGGYKMATNDVKTQSQAKATVALSGKIKQVFSTATNYANVTPASVVQAGLVPTDFKVGGTVAAPTINNSWGGTIVPAGAAGNTAFQLTIDAIPKDGCVEFLAGIASAGTTLTFAGTNVKTAATAFDPAAAAGVCKDSTGAAGNSSSTAVLVVQ